MSEKARERLQLLAATLVGCLIALALAYWRPVGETMEKTPVVEAITGDPDTPRSGPADAPVTLVVFTDYQCPICRKAHIAMQAVLAERRDVRVLYKDWPVLGPASESAARVALAADRQGIYPAVHDRLMRREGPLDEAALRRAVAQSGGSWARIEADLASDGRRIERALARHSTQAFSLGLAGTPGYLIGPVLVKGGLDERGFRRAIAQAAE